MKTSLQLFTDPSLLSLVGHRQVAALIERFAQLFPGNYVLPRTHTDNEGFIEVLTRTLAEPNDFPASFLKALAEVETLAGPNNVPNLNIPQNVSPQDPESTPLYHAILAWLSAHQAPEAPASSPSPTLPSIHPALFPPQSDSVRLASGAVVIGSPSPSLTSCSDEMASSGASVATPLGATPSGNGSTTHAPQIAGSPPELESDDDVSSRPGLRLRLSVLFWEIDPLVRHQFFAHFEKELRTAFPELPPISVGDQDYDNAVYALLKRPAFLPDSMRDALLAIQELATPENRQLLRALTTWRFVYFEKEATAEHVAVSYWLNYPFQPGDLAELRAKVPAHLLAPKPPKPGDPASGGDGLPMPDPQAESTRPNSRQPGDLAAIAKFPRNKIAKLSPDVRQQINVMLRLRVTYDDILARLGPLGRGP